MKSNERPEPLSWEEARRTLRDVLESYLDHPHPPQRDAVVSSVSSKDRSWLSFIIRYDYDLYFGAFLFSIGLLILSLFSLLAKLGHVSETQLRPSASQGVYTSQFCASVLLAIGACGSLWMVRRRRFLSLNDSVTAKRREVMRFLRVLKAFDEHTNNNNNSNKGERSSDPSEKPHVHGTSLTDIYRVYRTAGSAEQWNRIPSLLLVKGDFIALQCGDVAPANCVMLANGSISSIQIQLGARLSLQNMGLTKENVLQDLPRGRSTLQPGSTHLLTLCNRTQMFLVLDTPLNEFINRPPVTSRPSQSSRQIKAVRQSLSVVAIVLLVITSGILMLRADLASDDLSLLLTIPLMAALSVLPTVGPAFLFFLEALATARILATVHPYASLTANQTKDDRIFTRSKLVLRYMVATCLSRLSLWRVADQVRRVMAKICPGLPNTWFNSKLIRIPPASLNLVEKLGVATAFTLVDDELACEPHSIPQQLLIPSGQGLKLLDLCPRFADGSDDESTASVRKKAAKSFDSDSESEDGGSLIFHSSLKRKITRRKIFRRSSRKKTTDDSTAASTDSPFDVQFEEPTWWHFLPSLKCIGLASLLLDENRHEEDDSNRLDSRISEQEDDENVSQANRLREKRDALLVKTVCHERRSKQYHSLAHCIGFATSPNLHGLNGDVTPFEERLRLHIVSSSLVSDRMELDEHERSSEQSKWWGLLRTDSTSIVVQDSRSKAYQLLTVGDPSVVVDLCHEAWQGEISTILPLRAGDRETILETSDNWKLGDLDVAAFSYTPMPRSFEAMFGSNTESQIYLLNNSGNGEVQHPLHKSKVMSAEWSLMKNQIFLGLLASLVVPRSEIQNLLSALSDAGVRFVYFSPRNMRRQKELASQMGIDVAWNCAISLRPLESGKEDKYRMTSNYADWDVNAKLPHGVEDVKKHLEEVDNVPLLVSLYTDVTKETTKEMVEVFQDYSDTVISVGLSHFPRNDGIFSAADIAVGVDVLTDNQERSSDQMGSLSCQHVLQAEIDFVSAIASHACAFRVRGIPEIAQLTIVIEQGRASLEAAVNASVFCIFGFLSLSLFLLFSVCVPSTNIPYTPVLGVVLFLQVILPGLGFTLAMSDGDADTMKRVPPKNDQTVTFSRREGWKLYRNIVLKSIVPALLPQVLHLVVFGELMLQFESLTVSEICGGASTWVDIVRCDGLRSYSGPARISSGVLVLVELAVCVSFASAGFLSRWDYLVNDLPWRRNRTWLLSMCLAVVLTFVYCYYALQLKVTVALPWYYYVLAAIMPLACLAWVEFCKKSEILMEKRAEKLRRLQFETRLGAWSPK